MIHRCRVHLLPGPASMINRPRPGRSGQTPGPCQLPTPRKRLKKAQLCQQSGGFLAIMVRQIHAFDRHGPP